MFSVFQLTQVTITHIPILTHTQPLGTVRIGVTITAGVVVFSIVHHTTVSVPLPLVLVDVFVEVRFLFSLAHHVRFIDMMYVVVVVIPVMVELLTR